MNDKQTLAMNSSQPLYEQLMQHLRTAILTGQYEEGSQLPPESELCKQYGVSRVTTRRALQELVGEGLLERKQGKGTFVAPRRLVVSALSVDGFTGMTRNNAKAKVRILRTMERASTPKEAAMLRIHPGDSVYELDRLMMIDGRPLSIDRSIYDVNRFPGILGMVQDDTSTYDLMTNYYHHPNHRAEKEIVLTSARPEEAEILQCPIGETLFMLTKIVYDKEDVPNHISFNLIKASIAKLTMSYTNNGTDAR